jgi:signal transduction histidine kinase
MAGMASAPRDTPLDETTADKRPVLSRVLSLTAHEFRGPLTVVAGYIRMLLKERVGPVSDQQRHILEEAEKSCARMSALLVEVSDLAHLEAASAPFNRNTVDVLKLLREIVAEIPALPDREVAIAVDGEGCEVHGDAVRLKAAFGSVLRALRRELVTSDRLAAHVDRTSDSDGPRVRVTIGEANRIEELLAAGPSGLAPFDEWRGGNGLSLTNARRVIEAHAGRIWGARDGGKAIATIHLPASQH